MTITITHSGDGTTVDGTERGDAAIPHLKGAGFRWGRSISAWFLPRPWTYPTRSGRVRQLMAALDQAGIGYEIDDQGPQVTTSSAEREAEKVQRAEARAEHHDEQAGRRSAESDAAYAASQERASHIPFGQPILLGHHSQRRAERDAEKIRAGFDKSNQLQRTADHHTDRADTARVTANGPSVAARQRRIERDEAEARKLKRQSATGELNDYGAARLEQLRDQIAHDRDEVAQAAADGHKLWGPEDFVKGDMVKHRGSWYEVIRVNRKTLTVALFYGQASGAPIPHKMPYSDVSGQRSMTADELAEFRTAARGAR